MAAKRCNLMFLEKFDLKIQNFWLSPTSSYYNFNCAYRKLMWFLID